MISIYQKLENNGLIIREHRLKGKSLINSRADCAIILRVRKEAMEAGLNQDAINKSEMDGDHGKYGFRPKPYEAVFRFLQDTGGPFKIRMYDIRGAHPLNNSTVDMMTTVHNGIYPYDLNVFQVAYEYAKESILLAWYAVRR